MEIAVSIMAQFIEKRAELVFGRAGDKDVRSATPAARLGV
jgi:hypothetical protein